MELNEEELIKDVCDGSNSAMEALFDMYMGNSVKLAYLITGDWASAEDAVQEAFIRAFANIKSFNRSKKFKPWFTKIVVNEARRVKKTYGKYAGLEAFLEVKDEDEVVEDKVIEELNQQVLLDIINRLDIKYRLPIILKYYSGFSEKEMSKVLSIPTTTVKTRLYKARQRLKNDLITGGECLR